MFSIYLKTTRENNMTLSFEDIRLSSIQKDIKEEKKRLCARLLQELCKRVSDLFEKQTGLPAAMYQTELAQTKYLKNYISSFSNSYIDVSYVIRKKTFFRKEIVLKGTVFESTNIFNYRCTESHLDQLSTSLSETLALLKEENKEVIKQKEDSHLIKLDINEARAAAIKNREIRDNKTTSSNSSNSSSKADYYTLSYSGSDYSSSSSSCSSSDSGSSSSSSSCD